MTNYTVQCQLILTDTNKGDELFAFLQQHFINNIDQVRGNCWIRDLYPAEGAGNNDVAKFIGFWATFSSQEEREIVYNTIYTYKPNSLSGDNVSYQIIEKLDTGSPTFGSPLYNIVTDKWGMEC